MDFNNNSRGSDSSQSDHFCCCLCSLSGMIKMHKRMESHQCDGSDVSDADGTACNLCLKRLIASSRSNETRNTTECCFVKCKRSLRCGNLKRHYVSHMKRSKRQLVACTMCDKFLSCKSSMIKHQRIHLRD